MSGVPAWAELLPRFRAALERVPLRFAARQLAMNHTALAKLRDGVTTNPHRSTRQAIARWLDELDGARKDTPEGGGAEGEQQPELAQLLVGYLQAGGRGGAVLVERVLQHVTDPTQQKLVGVEIISALKQMWIAAGQPVPQDLQDLEAKILRHRPP